MSKPGKAAAGSIEHNINEILAQVAYHDLDLKIDNEPSRLPNNEVFRLYDVLADEAVRARVQKSLALINKKLAELPEYRTHHSKTRRAGFEDHILESIKKLVGGLHQFVAEALADKMASYTPTWMIPISFEGVGSARLAELYEIDEGKTTGTPILRKKTWEKRELGTDMGFVIGVVNCNTRDVKSKIVSRETLEGASSDDLEVFDAMHELERLYSHQLGVAFMKIDKDSEDLRLESDPALVTAAIMAHFAEEVTRLGKVPTSLSLFVASESYSLMKGEVTSFESILAAVPFAGLKAAGVDRVEIDFVSCSTAKKARLLMDRAEGIAREHEMAVSIAMHNGYIFNNITYCYADDKAPAAGSLPTLYTAETRPKKSTLLQVMVPGFSNIFSDNPDNLKRFADEKRIRADSDEGEGAKKADEAKKRTRKKLIKPEFIGALPTGQSFRYSAQGRVLAKDAADAPVAAAAPGPAPLAVGAIHVTGGSAAAHGAGHRA